MQEYLCYSDEELFGLMQTDDGNAFAALYERYWERLFAVAVLKLTNVQDAEDILHDVFVSIWKRRNKIVLRFTFHTYIASILKYEIINKLTETGKNKIVSELESKMDLTEDNSVQEKLNMSELQQRLESAVQSLPEKCRLVFRLSREEGIKNKDIAEILHVTPKTVENHIHHALRIIRSALNNLISLFL